MKAPNLHLNLLRENEKVSSSPVRLRVMLPILTLLLCVGCALWWAMLFTQLLLLRAKVSSASADLDGKKAAHSAILAEMAKARDQQAELDQLLAYKNGRRTYGGLLAQLADVLPMRVQLTSLSIPEQAPMDLRNPLNPRLPALLGPTGTTERVTFRLKGRTAKSAPVTTLMESLEGSAFKDWLVIDKAGPAALQSPRVHSFKQEATAAPDAKRLLAFDVEYRCQDRRFEK